MATIHFTFNQNLSFSLSIACFLDFCHLLILQTEYSVSETGSIYILDGKGGSTQMIEIIPFCWAQLSRYLPTFSTEDGNGCSF